MEKKDVPRYENDGFYEFDGAGGAGHVLGCHGGKLIDGVIRYPEGAKVDPEHAARVQALVDYSYRPGNLPTPNEELAELYGRAYTERFEELKKEKAVKRILDGVLHHIDKFRTPNE